MIETASPELIAIGVALLGLVFGSFITCASYRLPLNIDIVRKPSYCPSCDAKLQTPDLFPVLSWCLSKGACRHCKAKISARYPIIELVTALLFLLVYATFGISASTLVFFGMVIALMIMIVADFEHYIIPDEVHLWLAILAAFDWYVRGRDALDMCYGALFGLGLGLSLTYGYKWLRGKEGLGFGDVKFLAVAGLWLGPVTMLPFLVYSGLLGILNGLVWRALGKGMYYPFGPALAMSLFLCAMYPQIPQAFWNLLTPNL